MPYKDKELGKLKKREYYQRVLKNKKYSVEDKELLLVKQRATDLKRRQDRKTRAVERLGGKCTDCNKSYPLSCYDFHHTNPEEKDFNPCSGLTKTDEVFFAEIDKCILLCANCHRIRHSKYDTSQQ